MGFRFLTRIVQDPTGEASQEEATSVIPLPALETELTDDSTPPSQTHQIYGGTASLSLTLPLTPASSPSSQSNWSVGLQTALDQPPASFPAQVLAGSLVFCAVFGAWAWFGQVEQVGHAQGKLVPQTQVYRVDPVESGKVAHIAVKAGDRVQKGQVVLELDSTLAKDDVERLEHQIISAEVELGQKQSLKEKIQLEAKTRHEIAVASLQAHKAAITRVQSNTDTLKRSIEQLETEVSAAKNRLDTLQPRTETVTALRDQLKTDVKAVEARVERMKPVVREGAIAEDQIFQIEQTLRDRRQALTRHDLEVGNLEREQFEAEQGVRDRQRTLTQVRGEYQQALAEVERLTAELTQKQAEAETTQLDTQKQLEQIEMEITQLTAQITETQTLLNSAKTKLEQRFLYAPVDGIVSSLEIPNPGEVVQAGQTVAEIAPMDAPLMLSAKLPNRDAGFIRVGMPVQVKLDAYPYQDYGIVPGRVKTISPDSKIDNQMGVAYQVDIALDKDHIRDRQQRIYFKPGQTASADIIIRRRRILEVLLDPIRKLQKGGIDL